MGPRTGLDWCGKFRPQQRDSIPAPSIPQRVAIPTALSLLLERQVIKSMPTQSLNRMPCRYAWCIFHIRKESYEFDSRPCEQPSWSFKWFHSLPLDSCWGLSQGGSGQFFLILAHPSITTCHATVYNHTTSFQNEIQTKHTFHSYQSNASLLSLTHKQHKRVAMNTYAYNVRNFYISWSSKQFRRT